MNGLMFGAAFLPFSEPPKSLLYRFWSRVEIANNGCYEWVGSKHKQGYGTIWDCRKRRVVKTHRLSAELFMFPFDPKLCVLHRCDNPSCVNPFHLFQGTHTDNMRDMARKNRNKVTRKFGVDNHMSKLTESKVLAIRAEEGSCKTIADKYQVSPMTISRIRRRKTWPHL